MAEFDRSMVRLGSRRAVPISVGETPTPPLKPSGPRLNRSRRSLFKPLRRLQAFGNATASLDSRRWLLAWPRQGRAPRPQAPCLGPPRIAPESRSLAPKNGLLRKSTQETHRKAPSSVLSRRGYFKLWVEVFIHFLGL